MMLTVYACMCVYTGLMFKALNAQLYISANDTCSEDSAVITLNAHLYISAPETCPLRHAS